MLRVGMEGLEESGKGGGEVAAIISPSPFSFLGVLETELIGARQMAVNISRCRAAGGFTEKVPIPVFSFHLQPVLMLVTRWLASRDENFEHFLPNPPTSIISVILANRSICPTLGF